MGGCRQEKCPVGCQDASPDVGCGKKGGFSAHEAVRGAPPHGAADTIGQLRAAARRWAVCSSDIKPWPGRPPPGRSCAEVSWVSSRSRFPRTSETASCSRVAPSATSRYGSRRRPGQSRSGGRSLCADCCGSLLEVPRAGAGQGSGPPRARGAKPASLQHQEPMTAKATGSGCRQLLFVEARNSRASA